MMMKRIAIALAAPLLLMGCLLQPGKFTSDLTINADRSFTFSYQGEVIALDPGESMTQGLGLADSSTTTSDAEGLSAEEKTAKAKEKAAEATKKAEESAERETKRRAIAEALAKEAGYRTVKYLGNGKYWIDYQAKGILDHAFLYPFNSDAEIIFPFIAIELRKDGNVRMTAPGYSGSSTKASDMGAPSRNEAIDGVFTLRTNAEVVMHNDEDGAASAGGVKTFVWKVTPLTRTAPTAVLKMAR